MAFEAAIAALREELTAANDRAERDAQALAGERSRADVLRDWTPSRRSCGRPTKPSRSCGGLAGSPAGGRPAGAAPGGLEGRVSGMMPQTPLPARPPPFMTWRGR